MGQQGKHIVGHNNYTEGRSRLTANPARLAERAGSGTPANAVTPGQPGFRERVNFGEVIGDFVKDGTATPTMNGIIHYGKGGIHIVPAAPN
ncbi:MAG: polymorphic toxin type 50 domain-containing protein [Polyangiaceae bacterium]|nr:polymorphic toxin type 50 domain-containing protein [Polyangiaceae bacterium]